MIDASKVDALLGELDKIRNGTTHAVYQQSELRAAVQRWAQAQMQQYQCGIKGCVLPCYHATLPPGHPQKDCHITAGK